MTSQVIAPSLSSISYQLIYKILAKLLADRLATLLGFLIADDQTGFVPGRNISHTFSKLLDIQHWAHQCNIP